MGFNEYGQLGNGSTESSYTPILILNDPTILIINGGKRYNEWEPKEHIFYPIGFRKR